MVDEVLEQLCSRGRQDHVIPIQEEVRYRAVPVVHKARGVRLGLEEAQGLGMVDEALESHAWCLLEAVEIARQKA